ncbi:hypothetical protein Q5P01_013924 [Channa striata]|uniref:C-type lectin domain-containing protein n=1 Tax=Channa striata TaxID=64152 RepID=A0AA88MPZ3_CHASR|nr:hypothetical protein Q5P01_013924 [Channa striata]
MSQSQTGSRSSDRRFYRAVLVCLGLLSVFLLVGLGLGVHYHNMDPALAADFFILKNNLSVVSEERDRLKASLTEMTEELNRLQGSSKQNKPCPAGWSWFNFSCYSVSCEASSWDEGRQDCKDREADLVVIDSDEEQKFISDLSTLRTWIGLTDREEEGTWKWIDGSSLTLREWAENQPDNSGDEDCAHIRSGRQIRNNWNDVPCGYFLSSICEKKALQ